MSTGQIVAILIGFFLLVTIIAGCNIAVAAFQPQMPVTQPMYQGELDD